MYKTMMAALVLAKTSKKRRKNFKRRGAKVLYKRFDVINNINSIIRAAHMHIYASFANVPILTYSFPSFNNNVFVMQCPPKPEGDNNVCEIKMCR